MSRSSSCAKPIKIRTDLSNSRSCKISCLTIQFHISWLKTWSILNLTSWTSIEQSSPHQDPRMCSLVPREVLANFPTKLLAVLFVNLWTVTCKTCSLRPKLRQGAQLRNRLHSRSLLQESIGRHSLLTKLETVTSSRQNSHLAAWMK